jgi:hypothetical protein
MIVERTHSHEGRGKAWLARAACLGKADRVVSRNPPAHVDSFLQFKRRNQGRRGTSTSTQTKTTHSRHTHLRIWSKPAILARTSTRVYEYESDSERNRSVVAGGGCGQHLSPRDFSAPPHEEGDPNKRAGSLARSEVHSGLFKLPQLLS